MSNLKSYFNLLRIDHWLKNIFVLLGVIYSPISGLWLKAVLASVSFCLAASTVYIYNDYLDIESDKLHPVKRFRPLVTGELSELVVLIVMLGLFITSLLIGFSVSLLLLYILATYYLINIFYNYCFKYLVFLDITSIASGFLLRILAGTVGIGLAISWRLMIAATALSILLITSKRLLEKQLNLPEETRAVLKVYSYNQLNSLIMISALISFLSYSSFVYLKPFGVITILLALFGLLRLYSLLHKKPTTDNPVKLLYDDNWSFYNGIAFFVLTLIL